MTGPQIIKTPAGEELVVLPKADYEALLREAEERAEDAADIAIYDARKAEAADVLPAEVSMAIMRGESRIRAVRKWRGLTQSQLAEAAHLGQGYLSDIENRRRSPSDAASTSLAAALDVPFSWVAN